MESGPVACTVDPWAKVEILRMDWALADPAVSVNDRKTRGRRTDRKLFILVSSCSRLSVASYGNMTARVEVECLCHVGRASNVLEYSNPLRRGNAQEVVHA